MRYLFVLLALYILFLGVRYAIVFQRLLSLVLRHPRFTIRDATDAPPHVQILATYASSILEPLGFEWCCYYHSEELDADSNSWRILFQNRRFASFADVAYPPGAVGSENPLAIAFESHLHDGEMLLTVNGLKHILILKPEATIVQDPYAAAVEEHWRTHCNKLEELAGTNPAKSLPYDEFLDRSESHHAATLNQALKTRAVVVCRDRRDRYYLHWRQAIALTHQVILGSGREAKLFRQRLQKRGTLPAFEIPVEAEIDAFHRLRCFELRSTTRQIKGWILAISLVLFFLSASFFFDPVTILVLIGILFLHELGHFSVMRACGYKDTSIFFLPFFGAAASGRKDNATLSEQFLMLLAGPVPGVLLGLVLAIALPNRLLSLTEVKLGLSFLLILNYINLLPVLPLDGGRIVDLLLFSRHPLPEVLFKGFTVALLAGAGLSLGDPILLPLAIAIAFSIPASWASARLVRKLRRLQIPNENYDRLVGDVFRLLRRENSPKKTQPFLAKYRLVKEVARRYQEPHSSWQTRGFLFLAYLGSLFVGLLAIGVVFMKISVAGQSPL